MSDHATAALCAELCRRAYHFVKSKPPDIADLGLVYIRFLHTDGDQNHGFVAREPGTGEYFVVFRGSHGWNDWKENLDFCPSKFNLLRAGDIMVHGGFEDLLRQMWPALSGQLLDGLSKEALPTVTVCGHSLGGALATLAAACISALPLKAKPLVSAYTYGSPRCGNGAFADVYDRIVPDTLRVVFERDPVPRIDWGDGAHVGHHLPVDAAGRRIGRVRGWWDSVAAWWQNRAEDATLQSLRDHDVSRYVRSMERLHARGTVLP